MSDIEKSIERFLSDLSENHEELPEYITGPKSSKKGAFPKVLYSGPVWDQREILAIMKSVLTGKWISSGEQVRKFEKKFSESVDSKDSLMVNSGSSANLVMIGALKKYFNWSDGSEVIISSVGFPTTLNPLIQNNLTPVFVDISLKDLNWNLDHIESKITDRTVAVFSSPVLGNPYDLDRLQSICETRGIKIIGDNCDSLGTRWRGKNISSYFVASSYSFYPAHHITTGEGGMVSSNNSEIIRIARSLAWWGRDCYCVGASNLLSCGTCGKRFDKWIDGYDEVIDHKYYFVNVGYNLKPLDLQGSIGLVQIEKLPEIHRKRRDYKEKIHNSLERISGVRVLTELPEAETSWFGVPVVCESGELKGRLVRFLEENGIQTRNYFAGNILMHPAYRHLDDFRKYPNANLVLSRVFFVGCSPNYTGETIQYINKVITKYLFNLENK
tara:strand:- start:35 stop:1360 length:1326 start_codon:yes stop_codon:yes gene_type:complete